MTGPEDILEAVKTRWEIAGSTLPTLVPGGLHHGQAPETKEGVSVVSPYATVNITDGELLFSATSAELVGGGRGVSPILLMFEVTIQVYVNSTTPNTDGRTIRQEIDRLFNRDQARSMTMTPAICLDWRPIAGGGLMLDPERGEALDVAIVTRRWEATVQGVT